jgi:23S rRNA pseudouridine2605 synthase
MKIFSKRSSMPAGERIAKRLARAGVCSRREAERLIESGRVSVNGKKISSPALNVTADDKIIVNGKLVAAAETTQMWLYHKPAGLVTSHKDPQGRPTVFDQLPKDLPRVISIGRLDLNSEGLLLLTNDGELARKLELPDNAWIRRYRVRAFGSFPPGMVERMGKPVTIDGVRYKPMDVKMESDTGTNRWFEVAIREGKNREIRKIFEHFGLKVNRLIRVSYGPFNLGSLRQNEVKEVTGKVLKSFIGDK